MKLSVQERLVALSILPKEGDYATLKLLTNLKLSLSFSEEEIKDWGVTSDAERSQTRWKINGESDIPMGEKQNDIVISALKKLNAEKKLPDIAMSLYEKFIPTE